MILTWQFIVTMPGCRDGVRPKACADALEAVLRSYFDQDDIHVQPVIMVADETPAPRDWNVIKEGPEYD